MGESACHFRSGSHRTLDQATREEDLKEVKQQAVLVSRECSRQIEEDMQRLRGAMFLVHTQKEQSLHM